MQAAAPRRDAWNETPVPVVNLLDTAALIPSGVALAACGAPGQRDASPDPLARAREAQGRRSPTARPTPNRIPLTV
jgi:hypothetical protein